MYSLEPAEPKHIRQIFIPAVILPWDSDVDLLLRVGQEQVPVIIIPLKQK